MAAMQEPFLHMTDGYQTGAVLVSSWGYDQTNVDFYQIVKRAAKSVWLRPLLSKRLPAPGYGAMAAFVVPVAEFKDPVRDHDTAWWDNRKAEKDPRILCRLRFDDKGSLRDVRIRGHYATLWRGEPRYCSWYG